MHYLFRNNLPTQIIRPVTLECLSQQWVEWLPCTVARGGITGYCESCDIRHLLTGVTAAGSLVQYVCVLVVFREPLQHGQWFREVHLHHTKSHYLTLLYSHVNLENNIVDTLELRDSPDLIPEISTHRHRYFGELLADTVLHNAP